MQMQQQFMVLESKRSNINNNEKGKGRKNQIRNYHSIWMEQNCSQDKASKYISVCSNAEGGFL